MRISVKNEAQNVLDSKAILCLFTERLGTVFAPVKYDMQGNIDVSINI